MDFAVKYYLVSVYCYLLNKRLHLKLAAYSVAEATFMATAVNIEAVVYEIPQPVDGMTDNKKLIRYATGYPEIFN